jgi:hypothetical protein
LVGTTADFRRFGPPRSLPLNDLPGENRGPAGRIGEVRLAKARIGDREPDERDLEEAISVGRDQLRRVLLALPEEKLFRELEKIGETLTDEHGSSRCPRLVNM